MNSKRHQVLVFLLPLLALSWLLIAFCEPGLAGLSEHVTVGYILGTMFGQTVLASSWIALGPAPLAWRLPLSLLWIAVLLLALLLNVATHTPGPDVGIVVIMATGLASQWVLAQIPLWGLVVGYGIRLRHRDDVEIQTARDRQFGIRQLMVLTTIVAVVLAACRWVAVMTTDLWSGTRWGELPIFLFLAMAGVAMSVPLVVAALLPRSFGFASVTGAILVALATLWELPLVNRIGGGPDIWHLIFINAFQTISILAVIALIRWCGYTTARCTHGPPSAITSC